MTLPDDARCQKICQELDGEPMLTDWERDFITSNLNRTTFSTAQKSIFAKLEDKYEIPK
jgi:hypothetical protein